jgi:hypothetical protein
MKIEPTCGDEWLIAKKCPYKKIYKFIVYCKGENKFISYLSLWIIEKMFDDMSFLVVVRNTLMRSLITFMKKNIKHNTNMKVKLFFDQLLHSHSFSTESLYKMCGFFFGFGCMLKEKKKLLCKKNQIQCNLTRQRKRERTKKTWSQICHTLEKKKKMQFPSNWNYIFFAYKFSFSSCFILHADCGDR